MNRLSTAKRVQVVSALVEGNSVRSTCRMTGIAKGTVLSLLADLGKVCASVLLGAVCADGELELGTFDRIASNEVRLFVNL